MKKTIFLLSLLALLSCNTQTKKTSTVNSFTELKSFFKTPPSEYGTAPFWVWNDEMTEEKIDQQLEDFKSMGVGAVYVHPRPGLITDYLSERWNELFLHSVNKAKELDMYVWIYDENSYPSGFAGGHVPAQMPESYENGNGLILVKQTILQPEEGKEYKILLKKENDGYVNITEKMEAEIGKEGEYLLFELSHFPKSTWYGGHSYVDLLSKGVTEKFLEVTMEGYEKYSEDEFGKTVLGVFTDEPNIGAGKPANAIRWTPDLFNTFKETWGYDLETNLTSLFEDVGEYKKVRHNYYQVLLQMFVDRWSKPWYNYCEEKNLLWTGHYWEHGWPNPHHGGDNMAMYAWHQQPGIDMLFNNFNEDELGAQFGNIRAVKELSSVANQFDRKRTLSETYGGSGWMVTFEDLKRLGDWEYVLGVNHMNQHLSFSSMVGARKFDYPPSFTYHEPWFEQYKVQADYFSRLSLALSAGKQINTTLILEPTGSAWMYNKYIPDDKSWRAENPNELVEIGQGFEDFLKNLERKQFEYDLGSENIIKDVGSVKDGKFVVNKRAYDLVVLPPGMETIDKSTFELLKEYAAVGGKIAIYENTSFVDGSENEELTEFLNTNKNIIRDTPLASLKKEDFSINWNDNENGKLYHMRRFFDDGELLFMVNSSLKESSIGELTIKGKQLAEMNLISGEIAEVPANSENGNLNYSFTLPPAGSILLFALSEKTDLPKAKKPIDKNTLKAIDADNDVQIAMKQVNALTIDYLDIETSSIAMKNISYDVAVDTLYKSHGFDKGNPWFHAIQYKTDILDKDSFAEGTGINLSYYFEIAGKTTDYDLKSFEAVIENPKVFTVEINGQKVVPIKDKWLIDREFPVYAIGEYLKSGTNEIKLIAEKMSIHAEIMPIYIFGNFSLESTSRSWKIIPDSDLEIGSWKNQGKPFYSNKVSYSKKYNLQKEHNYIVELGEWEGILVEVKVNDKATGIIFTKPYSIDISGFINDGENKIEIIVCGSLRNLLGPHHKDKMDISGPWDWKYLPEHQPTGKDYFSLDYGLMEDYRLLGD